jgi:WD40 repeat protein
MEFLVKSNPISGSLRCISSTSNLGNRVRVGGQSGMVYEWEILGTNWENFEFQRFKEYSIGNNTLFQMVRYQNIYALGGRDAKIWITDELLNIHKQIDAHWFSIHALAFSPRGNLLASGSMDKSIRLWDANHGELLVHKELAHRSSVNQIVWLDHDTLISCSDDSQIISWKIKH